MNGKRCHKQNDSPNRNDLSSFLKVVNDVEVERRAGGKLFHARGPATANARSLDARRVDGTTRSYQCLGCVTMEDRSFNRGFFCSVLHLALSFALLFALC